MQAMTIGQLAEAARVNVRSSVRVCPPCMGRALRARKSTASLQLFERVNVLRNVVNATKGGVT